MPKRDQATGVLFAQRFLDRHAGAIVSDTSVAVVELVANAWDAYATTVDITWPNQKQDICFSILDNGKGMSASEFTKRWRQLDYDKVTEEGTSVDPPEELKDFGSRRNFGRNGRGRHAGFRFSDPYLVRTWKDGVEVTFEVRRGRTQPFETRQVNLRTGVQGHGTEVQATGSTGVAMTAQDAREVIGTRFLADPNFAVSIDGTKVTFDDVSAYRLREVDVPVPPFGSAHITMVDTLRADKTTRQHGIAWRVKNRLVGAPGWVGFDDERILDGRTTEAKRFQFIVEADLLEDSVASDWTAFEPNSPAWQAVRANVHAKIRELLSGFSARRRSETKAAVKMNLGRTVTKLPPAGRDRWNQFVDAVVDSCPSISPAEVEQVAGILANLEIATSKYGLVTKLHEMPPGDLDQLHQILADWTVRSAKIALDEIQNRLQLINELDRKLRDESLDEVADLQPLFERSLWVFGPEFESIEFTSNKGMTEVIRKLFGVKNGGTRKRPDFVIVPNGSVGFYSRDSHDLGHEVNGVARLVVAEIKRVGVTIGAEEKGQPWEYVKELRGKGLITDATQVTCFVLGSRIDPAEVEDDTKGNSVRIRALQYDVFIRRAEARMLGLREKLRDAPFLRELGLDSSEFLGPITVYQEELQIGSEEAAAQSNGGGAS